MKVTRLVARAWYCSAAGAGGAAPRGAPSARRALCSRTCLAMRSWVNAMPSHAALLKRNTQRASSLLTCETKTAGGFSTVNTPHTSLSVHWQKKTTVKKTLIAVEKTPKCRQEKCVGRVAFSRCLLKWLVLLRPPLCDHQAQ